MKEAISRAEIAGVILAGGKGSRINNLDKALLKLHNKALIEHVIALAQPQVAALTVNANHHQERYQYLNLPIVSDVEAKYRGPLAGIYAALAWANSPDQQTRYKYIACFAADVPSFPDKLVVRLASALQQEKAEVAWSTSGGQAQPLFSLWSVALISKVKTALEAGIYGPKLLIPKLKNVVVEFPDSDAAHFYNINTIAALVAAEKIIAPN